MQQYSTFREFHTDYVRMCHNPNDRHLTVAVQNRIGKSSDVLKEEIDYFLYSLFLETDPWRVFNRAIRENPKCKFHYKTKQDPWFNC